MDADGSTVQISALSSDVLALLRAAVVVALGRAQVSGQRRGTTALLATPALDTFFGRNACNHQSRHWIGPPPAEQGIGPKTDQQGDREVGTEHVLRPLVLGCL